MGQKPQALHGSIRSSLSQEGQIMPVSGGGVILVSVTSVQSPGKSRSSSALETDSTAISPYFNKEGRMEAVIKNSYKGPGLW